MQTGGLAGSDESANNYMFARQHSQSIASTATNYSVSTPVAGGRGRGVVYAPSDLASSMSGMHPVIHGHAGRPGAGAAGVTGTPTGPGSFTYPTVHSPQGIYSPVSARTLRNGSVAFST